jgi:HEAT repeat protein
VEDLQELLDRLASRDWRQRVEAVRQLAELDSPAARKAVVQALRDPDDTTVTAEATRALVRWGDEDAANALLTALAWQGSDAEFADHVQDELLAARADGIFAEAVLRAADERQDDAVKRKS